MGKLGCSIDGNLNETKFSEPMPWIGIYIAAASLACAAAMASDAISGFRRRKFWFPCKYFSINATSLTIIGVASKLSVDLNTPMPRHMDQLAKLSSTVLICTVMGNSMPSLGTMENREIFTNVVALGILVITLVVNICIQIGTGVIFVFWKEHAFVLFLLVVLLIIFGFSSLTVPTNKHYLELKYQKKYELVMKECSNGTEKSTDVNKLKEDLMRFWMMAHTSSPQFVMGRSVTCTAAGALCLLSAATLAETMIRSYLLPHSFEFCKGESDYKWSITLILVTQTIAVAVGTFAPATRWFAAIKFRCPRRGRKSCRQEFQLERYWIQTLVEMKECPLDIPFHNRYCRKLAHDAKELFLNLCIVVQTGIVFVSKVIRLISIYFVARIWICFDFCSKLKLKDKNNIISDPAGSESQSSPKPDLSRFVLHLEGEDVLVKIMMKDNHHATDYCVHRGQRKQPRYLIKLLEVPGASRCFEGVKEFDTNRVSCLDAELPPNCWALPVVTLASIAVALPSIDGCLIKKLIYGVNEGLKYVRLIENTLNCKKDLTHIRWAAEVVWLCGELYQRWLDVDLRKLSVEGKSPREVLEFLSDSAKNEFMEFKSVHMGMNQWRGDASKWPVKALAANSMYRISQTILHDNCEIRKYETGERLFETITAMISDILSACLTNLQRTISVKCLSSAIEEREDSVRHAVHLLGQSEKIMKLLEQKILPPLDPDKMADIDEWRLYYKPKNPSPYDCPSSESETVCSTSSEIYLTIDDDKQGIEKIDTACD